VITAEDKLKLMQRLGRWQRNPRRTYSRADVLSLLSDFEWVLSEPVAPLPVAPGKANLSKLKAGWLSKSKAAPANQPPGVTA
jgi:hypothetical protein